MTKTKQQNRQRFHRVASRRTRTCLEAIHSLQAVTYRSNYLYSNEQLDQIIDAIQNELNLLKNHFNNAKKEKPQPSTFDLKTFDD